MNTRCTLTVQMRVKAASEPGGFYWGDGCYIPSTQTEACAGWRWCCHGCVVQRSTLGAPATTPLCDMPKKPAAMSFQVHGQKMSDALDHVAKLASYPASLCDPTAKKMTPCKDEADFLATQAAEERCDLHERVDAAACSGYGCHSSELHCECPTQQSCQAANGAWRVMTCGHMMGSWDAAFHKARQHADELGTCTATAEFTLCDKTAKKMEKKRRRRRRRWKRNRGRVGAEDEEDKEGADDDHDDEDDDEDDDDEEKDDEDDENEEDEEGTDDDDEDDDDEEDDDDDEDDEDEE